MALSPNTNQCWQHSMTNAIAIVEDALGRSVPLAAIDVPILSLENWRYLDAKLKLPNQPQNKDAAMLCWLAGLWHHHQSNQEYEISGGRMINEALNCGTRTNAFAALLTFGERMGLDRTEDLNFGDYPYWRDRRFKMARLYKRKGQFTSAVKLNMRLSSVIPKNLPLSNRLMAESRILLNLAKAASSHGMLTGMGLILSQLATKRLRKAIAIQDADQQKFEHETNQHLLVRTIDTTAGIEFDLLKAIAVHPKDIASERLIDLFSRWDEADNLLADLSSNQNRTPFRQSWARFQCANSEEDREKERKKFRNWLIRMEKDHDDIRGLAIRRGQYAAMLIKMGSFDEAEVALEAAINDAERVCDWQVLSANYSRMAKLFRKQLAKRNDAEHEAVKYIGKAKEALQKLIESPKRLLVAICREEAELYRLLGQWGKALKALDEATALLKEMRKFLSNESDNVALSRLPGIVPNEISYVPVEILNNDERHLLENSLVVDWKIITSAQSDLLSQWITAFGSESRVEMQRFSSQRLLRYGSTLVHRIKNYYADSLSLLQPKIESTINEFIKIPNQQQDLLLILNDIFRESNIQATASVADALKIRTNSEEEKLHSVFHLITLLNQDLDTSRSLKELNITSTVEFIGLGDFGLYGFADEIKDYLYNCYENATRILAQVDQIDHKKFIKSKIFWQRNEILINEHNQYYGCLEITDSAGRFGELQREVNAIEQGKQRTQWRGLAMTISFLKEQYQCNVTVSGEEGNYSTLRFEFPSGAKVGQS